jgi:predicted RNA methylase
LCYIIYAGPTRLKIKFDGWDEHDIIEWVCTNYNYNCIGDLCMGTGLVGWYANQVGKPFVGIEFNPKRLAMLLESINRGKRLGL